MDWTTTLKTLAPTVALALTGPLGGAAVAAIGDIMGVSQPTQQRIADVITSASMTPEQVVRLKELELQYQSTEQERGFKYADLSFADRDSARKANVSGGMQDRLFWLSILLLSLSLGTEIAILFLGYPSNIPDIVVGRVLGGLDSIALTILAYWFGSSLGSSQKTTLLAAAQPTATAP